ncbi:MAG: hypothetical protein ABIL52_06565 [candidate division WOR-3 bacterium]|mgnify:CR=1 FL=1|jgi:hypothetical protein
MKIYLLIPTISYILAVWVIYSIQKPEVCSIYKIIPIIIIFLLSYFNEFTIKKTKSKFDKKTLALWSVSNLSLLYTAGSVLFVMFGGNVIISIILLIFGFYDNYKILKLLES